MQRALFDLAAELLEVQARAGPALARRRGTADDELVRDLVDSFPYEDTKDQAGDLFVDAGRSDIGGPRRWTA